MNKNTPLSSATELPEMNDRIMETLRTRQRSFKILTGIAMVFGFVAIASSIAAVTFYVTLYRPKQLQVLREYRIAAERAQVDSPAPPPPAAGSRSLTLSEAAAAHVLLTHVTSMGTMLVAVSVGVLGIGTMVSLGLIILNRRSTLQQIRGSLLQISDQLRNMDSNAGGPGRSSSSSD